MIAALKQYGTNVAKNTVKRQLVRLAVIGTLVIVGFVYKLVTGNSITSSDEPSSAPPPASAPAPVAKAAPITSPAQAAPITPAGIDINAPKRAAQHAVDATNAAIAAQTGQSVALATTTTAAPVSGPGSSPNALPAPSGALPTAVPSVSAASVTREVYGYESTGRRDPFFSLILTDDLRPLLGDLR